MHIVLNRYAGAAAKADAALPKVRQEFVPLLKGREGFLGYATMPTEQGDVVACLIWEDAGAMAASRDKIRGWVRDNLEGFEEPTERFVGQVRTHSIVAPRGDASDQPLYCLIQKSGGLPPEGAQRQHFEERLAVAKKHPGFRGMYLARSDEDPTRGAMVLFCDTKEQANAVHEATATMAGKDQPDILLRVAASGYTAVLAMG
jgi:heme-degrading monooxygenase HmoA/quinol monooxygenase YgiN